MKTRALIFILLLLCACNRAEYRTEPLWEGFDYAERLSDGGRRRGSFRQDGTELRMTGRSELRFPAFVKRESILRFTAGCEGGLVRVERDSPSQLLREFPAGDGQEQIIRLSEFGEAAVRISLVAPGRTSDPCTWGNLRLQTPVSGAPDSSDPDRLRKRYRRKNLLLIVLDAASASHFSCYGYPRNTTPEIDALAESGVVFDRAYSVAPFTIASTATLFTGLYPPTHQVILREHVLGDRFRTIAESFRDAGYRTGFFTANPNSSELFDFDRGFLFNGRIYRGNMVHADEFVEPVLAWIQGTEGQPFFGYLHFREPHAPYEPPQDYLGRFAPAGDAGKKEQTIAAYDAGLAFADAQIGRITDALRQQGLLDHTVIVVSADHGEELWEHGKLGHHTQLYEESIRIPLIVSLPGESRFRGTRRDDLVGNIDLMETFVDLFGLSGKGARSQGINLLPVIAGSPVDPDRALLSNTNSMHTWSLRWRNWKYIHQDESSKRSGDELYELTSDPGEKHNKLDSNPVTAFFLRTRLLRMKEDLRSKEGPVKRREAIDAQTEEQLRALGYVN